MKINKPVLPRELAIPAIVTLVPAVLLAVSTFLVVLMLPLPSSSGEGSYLPPSDTSVVDGAELGASSGHVPAAEPELESQPSTPAEPAGPTGLSATAATPPPPPAPEPAAPASQAPTAPSVPGNTMWDSLAQCEAGGDWHINTGNGYYGGLQFSPATWKGYGGHQYAPNAHLATREQQIEIAEKARAAAGMKNTWPACSRKLGLS